MTDRPRIAISLGDPGQRRLPVSQSGDGLDGRRYDLRPPCCFDERLVSLTRRSSS